MSSGNQEQSNVPVTSASDVLHGHQTTQANVVAGSNTSGFGNTGFGTDSGFPSQGVLHGPQRVQESGSQQGEFGQQSFGDVGGSGQAGGYSQLGSGFNLQRNYRPQFRHSQGRNYGRQTPHDISFGYGNSGSSQSVAQSSFPAFHGSQAVLQPSSFMAFQAPPNFGQNFPTHGFYNQVNPITSPLVRYNTQGSIVSPFVSSPYMGQMSVPPPNFAQQFMQLPNRQPLFHSQNVGQQFGLPSNLNVPVPVTSWMYQSSPSTSYGESSSSQIPQALVNPNTMPPSFTNWNVLDTSDPMQEASRVRKSSGVLHGPYAKRVITQSGVEASTSSQLENVFEETDIDETSLLSNEELSKSDLISFLRRREINEEIINAIIRHSYCDASIRMMGFFSNTSNLANVQKEYFTNGYFYYVMIYDHESFFSENDFTHFPQFEFCIARECIGISPIFASSTYDSLDRENILLMIREFVGNGYFVGTIGFDAYAGDKLREQKYWVEKCLEIVRYFDTRFQIPIIFHVDDMDFVPGKSSRIIQEFFHIIDLLPSAAVIIWNDFQFDWQIASSFISRLKNSFICITAREESSFQYLKNLSEDQRKILHERVLISSNADKFDEIEDSIRFGLKNIKDILFPNKSYDDVLKQLRINFEKAFYFKIKFDTD